MKAVQLLEKVASLTCCYLSRVCTYRPTQKL